MYLTVREPIATLKRLAIYIIHECTQRHTIHDRIHTHLQWVARKNVHIEMPVACYQLLFSFQITETYAFLPREAVTRFLLGCTECQKHPRSPSPVSVLPTPSPSPTLPLVPTTAPVLPLATLPTPPQTLNSSASVVSQAASQLSQAEITYLDLNKPLKQHDDPKTSSATPPTAITNSITVTAANCVALPLTQHLHQIGSVAQQCQTLDLSQRNGDISQSQGKIEDSLRTNSPPEPKRSSNPLDVCNLTSRDPPKTPPKKRHLNHLSDNPSPPQNPPTPAAPKLWSPVEALEREEVEKRKYFMPKEIDYSLPITTTYLKYMRSLGCTEEDALKFENKTVSRLIECFLHDLISHYFY